MTNGKKGKNKIAAVIIAAIVLCAAAGIIIFTCVGNNPHLIYRGDAAKVISLNKERQKTLRIGVSSAVADIHPYNYDDENAKVLQKLVYEPLLTINNDCKIEYSNAKKITFEADGKQVKVEINSSKTFSDGTKINSGIVYDSYRWFIENDTAYNDLISNIKSIQIVDDNTLEFAFKVARLDSIEIFNIPVIYQIYDENNESVALGTGCYAIQSLTPYGNIVLERNSEYSKKAKYDQVILQPFNFNEITSLLESQDFDIFLFNKNEQGDMIKENGAYDIYEMGQGTGWYLKYNLEDEAARRAVAKATQGDEFFEATQDFGVYSKGIVSAYMNKPNYHSMLKKGNFDTTNEITVLHDYSAVSYGIYTAISNILREENVQCTEHITAEEEIPENFEEDVAIYYGEFIDGLNQAENERFYKENPNLNADDFYIELEKHLAAKNRITPLSKDTVWIASLAKRDTLDLFD